MVALVLKRMINDGLPVIEFHREERKLEDAFIEIVGALEKEAAEPPPIPSGGPTA